MSGQALSIFHCVKGTAGRKAFIFGIVAGIMCFYFSFGSGKIFAALAKADMVVVIKSKRVLILMKDGEIFKTYRICLGRQPEGHKIKAGDRRTPEGRYILDSRNPKSKYYLAIHISYPNESDILNAQKNGASPGGGIMIHGMPNGFAKAGQKGGSVDWTDGCIAVSDSEMEEIWQFVPDGTPIEIKP